MNLEILVNSDNDPALSNRDQLLFDFDNMTDNNLYSFLKVIRKHDHQNIMSSYISSYCENNQKNIPYSLDLNFIKFLIKNSWLDINYVDESDNNCLMLACLNNASCDVIEYLIQEQKINPHHDNDRGNNCLMIACNNNNLDVIKYLIQQCNMDPNRANYRWHNCLTIACLNKNKKIIKYLIEKLSIRLSDARYSHEQLLLILDMIKDYYVPFNNLLKKTKTNINNNEYNPLLMNNHNKKTLKVPNPYEQNYEVFMTHVDKIILPLSVPFG